MDNLDGADVDKTFKDSPAPTGCPEQFTLLAFQQGLISSSQLRRAVRDWQEGVDQGADAKDLERILLDKGWVSQDQHRLLSKRVRPPQKPKQPLSPPPTALQASQPSAEPSPQPQAASVTPSSPQPQPQLVESQLDKSRLKKSQLVASQLVESLSPSERIASEERPQPGPRKHELSEEMSGHPSSRSNSRRGSPGKSPDAYDYYESVHASFTYQESLLPYLRRQTWLMRRRFANSIYRLNLSFNGLADQVGQWLWRFRVNILATSVGLSLFFAAVYYVSSGRRAGPSAQLPPGTLSPADSEKEIPTVEPHWNEHDAAAKYAAQAAQLPNVVEYTGTLGESPAAAARPDNVVVPATLAVSQPDAAPRALTTTRPPRQRASAVDALPQLWRQAEQAADVADFVRAAALLEQLHEQGSYGAVSARELQTTWIAALIASRQFDRAGPLLVQDAFVDLGDPTWDLLFASWLFYASPESRQAVGVTLGRKLQSLPDTVRAQRTLAWVYARNRNHVHALAAFSSGASLDGSSFGDAMFYALALQDAGQPQQAELQLQRAEQLLSLQSQSAVEGSQKASLPLRAVMGIAGDALKHYRASLKQ
ncbi:MAG: hypothetical protein KDA45_00690 [Planctomycetales bacterium]|nr:hypothetical protein [Planctomycetales bacterium]